MCSTSYADYGRLILRCDFHSVPYTLFFLSCHVMSCHVLSSPYIFITSYLRFTSPFLGNLHACTYLFPLFPIYVLCWSLLTSFFTVFPLSSLPLPPLLLPSYLSTHIISFPTCCPSTLRPFYNPSLYPSYHPHSCNRELQDWYHVSLLCSTSLPLHNIYDNRCWWCAWRSVTITMSL